MSNMEKLLVVKIGGNVIDDPIKLTTFLSNFSSVKGFKILIHGGGKIATELAQKLGIEQKLVEGRRITDADTLKVVSMVYAGHINKNIVAQLQANGCDAVGLTGADGNLILAHKRQNSSVDFGFVGDVDSVNSQFIYDLIKLQKELVIAPITSDGMGQLLNTNADTIAQEIAKAMSQLFDVELIYSFEKAGVLLNIEDENSVIGHLNYTNYQNLKTESKIFAGMIPKLDNAFSALRAGVKMVKIGKAEDIIFLTEGKRGTTITND